MVRARVLTVRVLARPALPPPANALGQDGYKHAFEEMVLPDDDLFHFIEIRSINVQTSERLVSLALISIPSNAAQNGGRPMAFAALSMVTANPIPMNTRCSVGFRMAVTMPTTSPSAFTSGPPELPGLAAASNWMRLVSNCLLSGEWYSLLSPDTTPAIPTGRCRTESHGNDVVSYGEIACGPKLAGARSSGWSSPEARPDRIRAQADYLGLDSSPSAKTTFTSLRGRPHAVRQDQSLVDDHDPVPTLFSYSLFLSASVSSPRTRTTDGLMAS